MGSSLTTFSIEFVAPPPGYFVPQRESEGSHVRATTPRTRNPYLAPRTGRTLCVTGQDKHSDGNW